MSRGRRVVRITLKHSSNAHERCLYVCTLTRYYYDACTTVREHHFLCASFVLFFRLLIQLTRANSQHFNRKITSFLERGEINLEIEVLIFLIMARCCYPPRKAIFIYLYDTTKSYQAVL